jgi:hypothetical protein
MAASATGYCSTFGIITATRAPLAMPRLCSHAARRFDMLSSSA